VVGEWERDDLLPVKKGNYTLTCQVEDRGRPVAVTYT